MSNEEVLHTIKEERNIIHTVNRRKANCIGHILFRNCLLEHIIEGKMEGRISNWKRKKKIYEATGLLTYYMEQSPS